MATTQMPIFSPFPSSVSCLVPSCISSSSIASPSLLRLTSLNRRPTKDFFQSSHLLLLRLEGWVWSQRQLFTKTSTDKRRCFQLGKFSPSAKHRGFQISEGDVLPSFSLKDQEGRIVSSSSFKGKPIVLYFYPADDTPGCTREACAFRDAHMRFKDSGAEVIGISSDSFQSHKAFAEKHRLPFTLLTDYGNKLRKEWGIAADMFGMLPGRQTYIIDKKGVVRLIFNNQFQPERHVYEALKTVEQMNVRGFGEFKKL
ncbi:hypothetical protein O6H91_11G001700 [Diphasiastrum complanatum]|uniref:Uncharacterized protein n=1 Tax=Diphasiastrum complanatum TaxID=34168 RepID=A0ACC2C5M3_DIPCM|nr:hypothetical protein O6H91_11G001700 [Diphasiastrum complanatum]